MLRIGIFPLKGICPLASAFPTKDFNYSKTQPLSNETFNGRDRNGGYFGWLFLKRRDCVGNTLAVDVSTYCTVRGLIKKRKRTFDVALTCTVIVLRIAHSVYFRKSIYLFVRFITT